MRFFNLFSKQTISRIVFVFLTVGIIGVTAHHHDDNAVHIPHCSLCSYGQQIQSITGFSTPTLFITSFTSQYRSIHHIAEPSLTLVYSGISSRAPPTTFL